MSTIASRSVPARPALRIATAPVVLALFVVGSTIARFAAVAHRATPRYFPDEYLYSELSRSIASGHGANVLGNPVGMPALLDPVISSLAWLPGDAGLAFRLTQGLHAAAMSLAAIPIYLICRRLSLSPSWSLGVTIAASAYPGLVYSGYVTADALGYLLCLVALHAALRMLSTPAITNQLVFLGTAACAAAARIQYVVLIPAVVLSALIVEDFRPHRAARRFAILGSLTLLGAVLLVARGQSLVGRYGAVHSFGFSREMAAWLAPTGFLLALACGAAIIPGAAAWVAATVGNRGNRAHRSFATLILTLVPLLVLMATVLNVATGSARFMERYLLVVMPLAAVAFAAWIDARTPRRFVAVVTAAAIAVGAAIAPLSGYAAGQGVSDSPLLLGFVWGASRYGVADVSLLVALVATLAATAGAAAALPRGPSGRAVLGLAVALLAVGSVATHATDLASSRRVSVETFAGRSPQWVDAHRLRAVTLIQTVGSDPVPAMTNAFWNASVRTAARLGAAEGIDGGRSRITVTAAGALLREGQRIVGPMLVANGGTRTIFAGTTRVDAIRGFSLLTPSTRDPRLVASAEGLAGDGWLSAPSLIRVFSRPGECRRAAVMVTLPPGRPPVRITVIRSGNARGVALAPGRKALITLDSRAGVPAAVEITTDTPIAVPNPLRRVSARATLTVGSCRP